jgi:hypothetical protein
MDGKRMADRFAGIVEVATASKTRVNLFLDAGYRLLAIKQQALWTTTPKGSKSRDGFVLKSIVYVVGRTVDVEPFDPGKAA